MYKLRSGDVETHFYEETYLRTACLELSSRICRDVYLVMLGRLLSEDSGLLGFVPERSSGE